MLGRERSECFDRLNQLQSSRLMPTSYAELFKEISLHPILWMVLALFCSTVAFKALCGINASVQLLRIAFLFEIFSTYGFTLHLHVILRSVLLLWSTVFFFVFCACAIACVRDREEWGPFMAHRVQPCEVDSSHPWVESP
jgi:hypothetical protein